LAGKIELDFRSAGFAEEAQKFSEMVMRQIANDRGSGRVSKFTRFFKGVFDVAELIDELVAEGVGAAQNAAVGGTGAEFFRIEFAGPGLPFSLRNFLQDRLVEREVRHSTLQARILFFQFPQALEGVLFHASISTLPSLVGRRAYANASHEPRRFLCLPQSAPPPHAAFL
jgi:hypothetical protein